MGEINNSKSYSNKFFIGLMLLAALGQVIFYKMMIHAGDNVAHISFASSIMTETAVPENLTHINAYPLYHIAVRFISILCLNDYYVAGVVVLTGANIASIIIMRQLLIKFTDPDDVISRYLIDIISIGYLIFEPISGILTDGRIYQRQCGPNPWHNPTITFVRPIGLCVFLLFVRIVNSIDKKCSKINSKMVTSFALLSALSVLAKPSFMMVFMPAMVIFSCIYIRNEGERFKDIRKICFAAVPAIAILLIQTIYFQYINDGTAGGVKFSPGGFSHFSFTETIKVCIATFPRPLVALLLYGKDFLKTAEVRMAYIVLLIGIIEMFMFTNGSTGDFSWGYDLAVGLVTAIVLGKSLAMNGKHRRWKCASLLGIFAYQVAIGVYYLLAIYRAGGEYWF